MSELDLPLRLAQFSQPRGSGRGCAMNVLSWELGEKEISDRPRGIDNFFGSLVRELNDEYCTHLIDGLLCSACSIKLLELAHLLVGIYPLSVVEVSLLLKEYGVDYRIEKGTAKTTRGISTWGIVVTIPSYLDAISRKDREWQYRFVHELILRARKYRGLSTGNPVDKKTTQRALKRMTGSLTKG